MMMKFEILPGLPATGLMHENFSASGTGKHSEGIVVRFFSNDNSSWVGNFQPGLGGATSVINHPDGLNLIVFAEGQAYVIDPSTKKLKTEFGGCIQDIFELSEDHALILGDGLHFERVEKTGAMLWRTKRISWDGMQNVRIEGDKILGEAFTPLENKWLPFSVDLYTGEVDGGSYNSPLHILTHFA